MKAQGHITVRRRPKDGADGRGILTVTTYYLASSASSGVTTSTSGWTTAIQEVTSAKRYLWTFTRTTYTAGSTVVDTTPAIIRVFADTGLTYRTSKYTVGVTYRNDNNPYYRDANGVGYIDIVYLNEISIVPSGNPASAFICNKTHAASAATPAVGELWTAMNTQQPIYTALLLTKKIVADYIDVDTLVAKYLKVKNNNTVVAYIGDSDYPIMVGSENASTAVTKIAKDGTLTTTKLVASGSFESSIIAEEYHGNVQITGGAMTYNVSGNGYGGTAVIGYRSSSDRALISAYATQEDPALYVEHSNGEEAIRIGKGHLGLPANTGIQLYEASSYIESLLGFYKGFKVPIHRVYSSTNIGGGEYENTYHTIIAWGSAITLSLSSNPVNGREFDIIPVYYDITLNCNGKYCMYCDGSGSLTEYTATTARNITLSKNRHYKLWYDGTCWQLYKS